MLTSRVASRAFSSSRLSASRVAVLGAAGGIGQPLSLLLKQNNAITQLNLYDLVGTPGVAADLSHINSRAKVVGYKGKENLAKCLEGADIIVIPAGVPRKPGMTRDDLFNTNAGIVAELVHCAAITAPNAHILIIANPVNSTVPIAAEILKKYGKYDPRRLFGVSTLDVVRANTFVSESQGWAPDSTDVTVVGGHAGVTILPLLSQVKNAKFTPEQIAALNKRIQFGGDEVVQAKDGAGSATLSMAFAGDRFVGSLLRALGGAKGVSECSFVESPVVPGLAFFATRVELGPKGVEKIQPIGTMSEFEKAGLEKAVPELKASIAKGVEFAAAWKPKSA